MTGASKSKSTSRRSSDGPGPGDSVDERRIPARKLSPEQESQLAELAGFSRSQLYNRRGWHSEKGLAYLLDPGDVLEEIRSDHVVIRTASGARQTLYNLEKETHFLKRRSRER